jgi:hypothetical protein
LKYFLAVAHALNNESTDLAVQPIQSVISEVTQAKGN